MKAGLPHIEITLRTECALEAMKAILKEFPDMTVGAGTIIDPETVPELVDMGRCLWRITRPEPAGH
jgi:2-dehydro-3-deoxyphosphogluconate aldolase/(4S)-4-hydroxy-2-oxoglutarate aldolase